MSILENAITVLSNNHNLRHGIDSNNKRHQAEGRCPLSSGIEYSFVGVFCQEIIREILEESRPDYHEFFFIPNLKAEAKVGYDLSVGHYCQNNRVRTMHKVINEKYCDQAWSYRLKSTRNERGEPAKDYGHFLSLINTFQRDPELPRVHIDSFLVINICHCIHDYRRMGFSFEQEQLVIPSFRSILRTVIVDLRVLRGEMVRLNINESSPQFYLKVSRRPERRDIHEPSHEYIARIENKTNITVECSEEMIDPQLVILSFDEFVQRIDWNRLVRTEQN